MWYFAWMLGVGFAVLLAIMNAMWGENEEARRLADQAATLADLLHHDTAYGAGEHVLEAGCGIGAQTVEPA